MSDEERSSGRPVKIHAQVLVCDQEWDQSFVYDGRTSVYIKPSLLGVPIEIGTVLQLSGQSALGDVGITNLQCVALHKRPLPAAKRASLAKLPDYQDSWVELQGVVRWVQTSDERLIMVLGEGRSTCLVQVQGTLPRQQLQSLTEAAVGIRGVVSLIRTDETGKKMKVSVPSSAHIRVIQEGRFDLRKRGVSSIEALLNRELGAWTNDPVRLNGTITGYKAGEYVVLKDPTGTIRARVLQYDTALMSERVDLWGFLEVTPREVILRDAWFENVNRAGTTAASAASTRESGQLKLPAEVPKSLTHVGAVRKLTNEQARQRIPVLLQGVVTYADPDWTSCFIQDETGGVYFSYSGRDIKAGDFVELKGRSGAGQFAPVVEDVTLKFICKTNLPPVSKVGLGDLSEGQLDSHLVQLDGVVRRVMERWGHFYLTLTAPRGTFKVVVPSWDGAGLTNLIDIPVTVSGVCGTELNARSQVSGILLHTQGAACFKLREPIPTDPFDTPNIPVSTIGTFSPERPNGRRVKVSGCVTMVLPGQRFFLQDESGGISVIYDDENRLNAGDLVEVLGFAALADSSPYLEDATVKIIGQAKLPEPIKTTAERILLGFTNDAMLVSLEAQVLQYSGNSARPKLVLQDGPIIYVANIVQPPEGPLPPMPPGTRISLSGICDLQSSDNHGAEAFEILISNPASLRVIVPAPWWTARHTLFLAGGLCVVMLGALVWIRMLRRRVLTQTELIRQKLKERNQFAETLAYERDLLKSIMESLPDPLFFKDLNSRFVRVSRSKVSECYDLARGKHCREHLVSGGNERVDHMASLEAFNKHMLGKSESEFCDPERAKQVLAEEQQIIATGEPVIGRLTTWGGHDGETSWHLVTKMPWKDKHGKIIGTFGLTKNITSIKQAEAQLEKVHRDLLVASRQAGMAEVATSVLHNVGNVLNSVNVSASVVSSKIRASKAGNLSLAATLMREHSADLGRFMTEDPRGRRLPDYLGQLAEHLSQEQKAILSELHLLTSNIEHIKDIVTMQQNYAKVAGVAETTNAADLVEDALRMNVGALARHEVQVVRNYQGNVPQLTVEKHKVLQILVNLIRNAKYACDESGRKEKLMTVSVANGNGRIKIAVSDNGVGIPEANMKRIFNHGFTTRANGHGFGLHSGALAARELGGTLRAHSAGTGHGATFTLELPISPEHRS